MCSPTFVQISQKGMDDRSHYNPLKTNRICVIYGLSAYHAVNTLHHGYKNQSVNVVYGKSCCLFWDPYKTHKYNVISMQNFLILNMVIRKVTASL